MEDIKLLEYLVEDFKRSGIEFNLELVRLGGVVEIEYNLNINKEIFKLFKNDQLRNKYLVKQKFNISDSANQNKSLFEFNIFELLSMLTGNETITKEINSQIEYISEECNYSIYSYINGNHQNEETYNEIFLDNFLEAYVIIFESENRIASIGVHWTC